MNDKQPDHNHGCPSRRTVVLKVFIVPGEDDSDDEVREGHAESSDCENGFAAETVDVEDCGDGSDEHDNTDHACCEEGLRGSLETDLFEDLRRVVEDLGEVKLICVSDVVDQRD